MGTLGAQVRGGGGGGGGGCGCGCGCGCGGSGSAGEIARKSMRRDPGPRPQSLGLLERPSVWSISAMAISSRFPSRLGHQYLGHTRLRQASASAHAFLNRPFPCSAGPSFTTYLKKRRPAPETERLCVREAPSRGLPPSLEAVSQRRRFGLRVCGMGMLDHGPISMIPSRTAVSGVCTVGQQTARRRADKCSSRTRDTNHTSLGRPRPPRASH
jgi:hypothetical protein